MAILSVHAFWGKKSIHKVVGGREMLGKINNKGTPEMYALPKKSLTKVHENILISIKLRT